MRTPIRPAGRGELRPVTDTTSADSGEVTIPALSD